MKMGAAVGLVLGTVALSGCATSTVATKADGSKSTKPAKIGQSISLKGNSSGEQVRVVATKARRTRSSDEFSKPKRGDVFYAVQFRLRNTGTAAYDDTPSNGAKVIDSKGQQYDGDVVVSSIAAGPLLPSDTKIAAGNQALGYVVFEVPAKAKIKSVQFSMDSGFGDTGQWNLR